MADAGGYLFSDGEDDSNGNAIADLENPDVIPDSSDEGDLEALDLAINEQVAVLPSEDKPPGINTSSSKPDSLVSRAIKGYNLNTSIVEDSNGTVDPRNLVVAPAVLDVPTSTSSAATDVTEKLSTQAIQRLRNGESTSEGTSVTASTSLATSSGRTTPAPPVQPEDPHVPDEPRSDDFVRQMQARDANRPRPRKTVQVRQEKEAEKAKSTSSAPTSKASSSKASTEPIQIAGTSDDEMLLAPNSTTSELRKTSKSSTKSSASTSAKDVNTSTKSKNASKSSKRKIADSEDEDDENSWMLDVQKAQAKEEEDDDDFDAKKGTSAKDRWNKNKSQGKETTRKNSKGKAKETKAKPDPKKKNKYTDTFYDDDTGSEAPARGSSAGPVPVRRNTPRRGKAAAPAAKVIIPDEEEASDVPEVAAPTKARPAAKKAPAKEKKGDKQPRSAEFVDDEDMEDDTKDGKAEEKEAWLEKKIQDDPEEKVVTVKATVGSTRKPSKTYSKRDKAKQQQPKKSRNIIQSDDEEEGDDNDGSEVLQPLALNGKAAPPSKDSAMEVEETPIAISRPNSAASSTSSKKSRIEVVVYNTKKKNTGSAPVSTGKKAVEVQSARKDSTESALSDLPLDDKESEEEKEELSKAEPAVTTAVKATAKPSSSDKSSGKENVKSSKKPASKAKEIASKPAPKKKAAVVESEEEESDEDDGADISEAEESDDEAEKASKKSKAKATKPDAKADKSKTAALKATAKESSVSTPKQPTPKKNLPQALTTKDANSSAKATPISAKGASTKTVEAKPMPTGFLGLVSKFGGGLGVRTSGLSKTKRVPSLLNFIGPAPAKRPPLPPAPVRKPKKGEEVYSDDDMEEKRDQPEEWWDAEDYHAWETRKRKRAKARGEIDSDEERELSKKKSRKARTDAGMGSAAPAEVAHEEHFSD